MVDREENGERLPPLLRDATRLLREEPVPRREWRNALDRAIATEAQRPIREPRRWTLRPLTAVAAGLVCAVLGGATVALVQRAPAEPRGLTASTPIAPASLAPPVRFALVAPHASRVSIVGDFNRWDPAALPLKRSADGRMWEIEVPLQPGRYEYSFMVDGALALDPAAPRTTRDDFGQPSSVLLVRGS